MSTLNPTQIFSSALELVNKGFPEFQVVRVDFEQNEHSYQVFPSEKSEVKDPKFPIWISLQYPGKTLEPIGITHVVCLEGENWDDIPWEKLARTVDQCAVVIKTQVQTHLAAMENPNILISDRGTKFDTSKLPITVEGPEKYLVIEGKKVMQDGVPISINHLHSEGVITFVKLENGHYEMKDLVDKRVAKGMFVDLEGNLYRA